LEKSWEFFSSPLNLKILTPEYLSFEMRDPENCKMYAGQIISYTIRPFRFFPLEWVTEIAHVDEPHYFIDEQRFGPYTFWHHEHRFKAIPNGVDMVHYKMPFWWLGKALHALKIKKDLEKIFSYRSEKLKQMFGPYKNGGQ